jgi:curved DNA-binding protein CbpA
VRLAELEGSVQGWRRLLGGETGDGVHGSTAEVKRRYKRLAALLHPDKNALPGAAAAFQAMQLGMEGLLKDRQADYPSVQLSGQPGKRRRNEKSEDRQCGWDSAAPGDEDLSDGNEDDEDNNAFPWWGPWDAPCSSKLQGGTGGSSAAPAAASATSPPDEFDKLSTEGLGAEVAARQQALLGFRRDETGQLIPLSTLRSQLDTARTALRRRLEAEAAEGAHSRAGHAGEGGFLRPY